MFSVTSELLFHAILSMTGVMVGSLWMGPKLGPAVRSAGWKLVLIGIAVETVLKVAGN